MIEGKKRIRPSSLNSSSHTSTTSYDDSSPPSSVCPPSPSSHGCPLPIMVFASSSDTDVAAGNRLSRDTHTNGKAWDSEKSLVSTSLIRAQQAQHISTRPIHSTDQTLGVPAEESMCDVRTRTPDIFVFNAGPTPSIHTTMETVDQVDRQQDPSHAAGISTSTIVVRKTSKYIEVSETSVYFAKDMLKQYCVWLHHRISNMTLPLLRSLHSWPVQFIDCKNKHLKSTLPI
jgi:hypothetical protein